MYKFETTTNFFLHIKFYRNKNLKFWAIRQKKIILNDNDIFLSHKYESQINNAEISDKIFFIFIPTVLR